MDLQNNIRVLFLGDVIGKPGRRAIKQYLAEHAPKAHLIIANAENAAHGFGTTESNLQELRDSGVHAFTGGNHTFDRKEIFEFIDQQQNVIRPANYPDGTPGQGACIVELEGGVKVGIINLLGRVFMEPLESPFLVAERLVAKLSAETKIIIVDMHAEATAEKIALALYLDGKVSAVVGTHTHVQTADERILPGGTAFLTDAGCCGPINGVIGMDQVAVFRRMVKQLPSRFEVAEGPAMVNGVVFEIDTLTGKATSIRRIQFKENKALAKDNDSSHSSELSQIV
jgi:2',3'-cyclic-nucleotide 2'-phosphodiesterase